VQSKLRVLPDGPALRQADAVLSHLWFPGFPRAHARPVIWSSQGISPSAYYDYVDTGRVDIDDVIHLYRVLGERSDALVIHTESCAKNVVDALPQLEPKIHVIAPCVFLDVTALEPKPSSHDGIVRFLFVGMDAKRKGLREVLRAYGRVRQRTMDVDLTVVSRMPPSAVKAAEAQGAKVLTSNPEMNVRRLMAEADVFVLPTHADTYAAAAVEAMGHGCAVLISDLEPLPEVAPDGEVGFVVERRDVAALSERMAALAGDLDLLRRFQAGARRLFTIRNDPDVVRRKLIRVVDDVVAGR
jgi:glycosyltransferase involved in cell wall biosynthesis